MVRKKFTLKQRRLLAVLLSRANVAFSSLQYELTHGINALGWLYVISPKAQASQTYTVLLHDCERFFQNRRVIFDSHTSVYKSYKQAHARNSAEIARKLMEAENFSKSDIEATTFLIKDHERGSTVLSYQVMAADSLSFFDTNIVGYYYGKGADETKKKIRFMWNRLKPPERQLVIKGQFLFKKIPEIFNLFREVAF